MSKSVFIKSALDLIRWWSIFGHISYNRNSTVVSIGRSVRDNLVPFQRISSRIFTLYFCDRESFDSIMQLLGRVIDVGLIYHNGEVLRPSDQLHTNSCPPQILSAVVIPHAQCYTGHGTMNMVSTVSPGWETNVD